ncbi:MAG: metal-dependent hydrolase, partial [Akkermansiaceae bacterium]
WGALFGTLPDLDILAYPFLDQVERMKWHRGISHSFLAMFLVPFLLAWPLARLHRARGVSITQCGWFIFLAWSTHVLIDCFTTYGTQVWEPFSDRRESLGNIFIVDLFFTLPMLIGLVMVLFHEPNSVRRRRINATALFISTCYVALSFCMKFASIRHAEQFVAEQIPGGKLVATSPTFSNIVLWRSLIETEDGYYVRYWSPFDKRPAATQYFPKSHQLAEGVKGEELFQAVEWFSRGHYVVRRGKGEDDQDQLIIIDMRYGGMRNVDEKTLHPTFQWRLSHDDGEYKLASYRPKRIKFWQQIKLIGSRALGELDDWESVQSF